MPIAVHLPTALARLAGTQSVEMVASTVGEVIVELTQKYPLLAPRLCDADGQPSPFITFYLNDDDIRFKGGVAAPLVDGDEITVVAAIAGG